MTPRPIVVYALALAPSDEVVAALAETLSAEERARAARLVIEHARRQFVVARALLRRVLGAWLGVEALEVQLAQEPRGRPVLGEPHASSGIRFNLSHSGMHGLLAVARDCVVGCDLEVIRPEVATQDIARRYFAPGEVRRLAALPASERSAAFFRCWTRKEAYLKALGSGLAVPLDAFEVSLAPGDPPALLRAPDPHRVPLGRDPLPDPRIQERGGQEPGGGATRRPIPPTPWDFWDVSERFPGCTATVVGEHPTTLVFDPGANPPGRT